MMAANYRHIGGLENRLGRHYSRFSASGPAAPLAAQSLARRKSPNHGSNRRSQANAPRIRLSDKTSRLRPRRAAPTLGQTYEPEVPVEVREWIRPASASPDLVFGPQPPAQPHRCVAIERAIGLE